MVFGVVTPVAGHSEGGLGAGDDLSSTAKEDLATSGKSSGSELSRCAPTLLVEEELVTLIGHDDEAEGPFSYHIYPPAGVGKNTSTQTKKPSNTKIQLTVYQFLLPVRSFIFLLPFHT